MEFISKQRPYCAVECAVYAVTSSSQNTAGLAELRSLFMQKNLWDIRIEGRYAYLLTGLSSRPKRRVYSNNLLSCFLRPKTEVKAKAQMATYSKFHFLVFVFWALCISSHRSEVKPG